MKSVEYAGKLGDYHRNGYTLAYERGYLSRRTKIDGDTPVYVSGDGRLYYYRPCYHTTRYKYRVYLNAR